MAWAIEEVFTTICLETGGIIFMSRCLCGDTYCPSCGPAQGYDDETERFYNSIYKKFPKLNQVDNIEEVIKFITDEAYAKGYKASQADTGGYIENLKSEIAEGLRTITTVTSLLNNDCADPIRSIVDELGNKLK